VSNNDPDFERRINNQLATIVENQARFSEDMLKMQEALAGLIQVARLHDERIDVLIAQGKNFEAQFEKTQRQIDETSENLKQVTDNLNALLRVVDQHVTNHP
jgi:hypothetical protein